MNREQEYRLLADNAFKRAVEEESAQLIAQWKILGAKYLELADQSKNIDARDTPNGRPVVSVPGRRTVRIEAPPDSAIPDKLMELGYRMRHHGQTTRTGPNGFTPARVFEVDLPI